MMTRSEVENFMSENEEIVVQKVLDEISRKDILTIKDLKLVVDRVNEKFNIIKDMPVCYFYPELWLEDDVYESELNINDEIELNNLIDSWIENLIGKLYF